MYQCLESVKHVYAAHAVDNPAAGNTLGTPTACMQSAFRTKLHVASRLPKEPQEQGLASSMRLHSCVTSSAHSSCKAARRSKCTQTSVATGVEHAAALEHKNNQLTTPSAICHFEPCGPPPQLFLCICQRHPSELPNKLRIYLDVQADTAHTISSQQAAQDASHQLERRASCHLNANQLPGTSHHTCDVHDANSP